MRFSCERCERTLTIDDGECGKTLKCGHCGETTLVPIDRLEPRSVLNDFVLLKSLGIGKTGQVFLARQLSLDRQVALRVLRGNLKPDDALVVGLFREARAASRLFHSNIAQSLAVGEEDGIYYQAMEYVDGRTLLQVIQEDGPLATEAALEIFRQVAEGLDFAWQHQQMVYRALSPLSIMITSDGVAKLVDFSAAYTAPSVDEIEANNLLNTPYASPEDILGQNLDVRSDIYSLGATMYHAVTGQPPYMAATPEALARQITDYRPPAPIEVRPDLPERLSLIIQKMMARLPDHRYPRPDSVVDELRRTAIAMA